MTYSKIISDLEETLEANADADYAPAMSAYMKNKFSFFGIKSPRRKELAKPFVNELIKNHKKDYWAIAESFWDKEEREFHYIAIEFLQRTHSEWNIETINLLKWLILNHSWWDTVDFMASNLVGKYIQKFYPDDYSILDKWNTDENIWIARTSIIFQLKFKGKVDWELLQKYIANQETSNEFFIRKAIGWMLREYSKTDAETVIQFVEDNPQLSGLTKREALKWLNRKK